MNAGAVVGRKVRRLSLFYIHTTFSMMDTVNEEKLTNGEKRPDSAIDIKDDYVLTRDAAASARLNLSHYIWLASFGFNLHPRIAEAIRGREDVKVADVGTGTG